MKKIKFILISVTALVVGLVLVSGCHKSEGDAGKTVKYTCPMHPEVMQTTPGNCPKCGMTLIPIRQTSSSAPVENNMMPMSCCAVPR